MLPEYLNFVLMIRLGIIEDDRTVRRSLVGYFSREPGFSCLLNAGSVEEFMDSWAEDMYFDIILSDIGLPGVSGSDGVRLIRKKAPKCQVVMLTVYEDSHHIFEALRAGASGYLSKQTLPQKIKEALNTVHEGGAYMSPGVARRITDYFHPLPPSSSRESLTIREEEILQAVEEGLTNKEIAANLGITSETVKSHIKKIYTKLEVTSRRDIVRGKYK